MADKRKHEAASPIEADIFGRPIPSSHWRYTMPPAKIFGFPVAAYTPLFAALTPLPNITGWGSLFKALGASLVFFFILDQKKFTPRMALRWLLGWLRGPVTYPVATKATPRWERGLMQPLQLRKAPGRPAKNIQPRMTPRLAAAAAERV
jgi:hypothetical protein